MRYVTMTIGDRSFNISTAQAASVDALTDSNGGGFATVKCYVSTSGRTKPETADITFISRFSVSRLYERKIAKLKALTLDDIRQDLLKNPKVKAMDEDALQAAFDARKATEIASMQQTLDGVGRSQDEDASRAAHDRNYVTIADGVKVHFLTEKVDGVTVPVLAENGLPTVDSVMLGIIEINRTITDAGEYKAVNNGVPVLISKAMEHAMPKSCKYRTISLKENNFQSLAQAGNVYLGEHFAGVDL